MECVRRTVSLAKGLPHLSVLLSLAHGLTRFTNLLTLAKGLSHRSVLLSWLAKGLTRLHISNLLPTANCLSHLSSNNLRF